MPDERPSGEGVTIASKELARRAAVSARRHRNPIRSPGRDASDIGPRGDDGHVCREDTRERCDREKHDAERAMRAVTGCIGTWRPHFGRCPHVLSRRHAACRKERGNSENHAPDPASASPYEFRRRLDGHGSSRCPSFVAGPSQPCEHHGNPAVSRGRRSWTRPLRSPRNFTTHDAVRRFRGGQAGFLDL